MRTVEEFLNHGGPLKALRFERGRWSCLHNDGWRGTRPTVENALFTFCGTTGPRDRARLWRELREAMPPGGVVVFPLKERGPNGTHTLTARPAPPKVKARDTGRQYVIECPYCGDTHYHGRGEGHRVAHCHGRTPATLPGYVLEADA